VLGDSPRASHSRTVVDNAASAVTWLSCWHSGQLDLS
jgi:hypothetical protein